MTNTTTPILLIEDDEIDILNIQRLFEKYCIHNPLHIANDGFEALTLLRGDGNKNPLNPIPKIVLLDINMPKMNGIEFLKEIRADDHLKPLTVFVLTTSDAQKDINDAYRYNIAGYILKPIDFSVYAHSIEILKNYLSIIEMPK